MDFFREMWERGFDQERLRRFLNGVKKSLAEKNINTGQLYPPGIYPFKNFEEAENDLNIKIRKRR